MTLAERTDLVGRITALREEVAEIASKQFFQAHPDWWARYGERGYSHALQDAKFHIDFLSGAIQAESVGAFQDYVTWAAGVLAVRGIEPVFLDENLDQIANAFSGRLPEPHSRLVEDFLRSGRESCQSFRSGPGAQPSDLGRTCRLYTQAILSGLRTPALNVVLEALSSGDKLLDIYCDVLERAQIEVGRLWETNQITVAQEHMATAISQFVLAQLYSRIDASIQPESRAVITGVSGELHHLGSNLVADALEGEGWDVRFLGTNLPHSGIIQAASDHKATLVGISVTMLFNLPAAVGLIASIRETFPGQAPTIVLGGGAFRNQADLWKQCGADCFAPNVREALKVCAPFLDAKPK